MKSKVKILLTGAGTATCGNVINALRQQQEIECQIITADINPLSYGLYLSDGHYLIPKANDPTFIPVILSIIQKESIDVVIPLLSSEFPVFAQSAAIVEKSKTKLPISSVNTIELCTDKYKTYEFFRNNGIKTPKTWYLDSLPEDVRYPLFLKPLVGSGTKHAYKINSQEELIIYAKDVRDGIVQEYIEGIECTIDILADFESRCLAAVPRYRLDIKDGKSYKGRTFSNKALLRDVNAIIKNAKIVGPANIQCFEHQNQYIFTEINPRFSAGGLPLTVASGVNTPISLIKLAMGLPLQPTESFIEGLTMIRYLTELFLDEKEIITS